MQKQSNPAMLICLICLVLALSACAPIIGDHPLEKWTPDMHRELSEQIAGDRSGELLVFLAFSGGGTRAASFSYGVLQELANTEVVTEKGTLPLIKEVDMISSVSGGSFTSAYYGLYGDRIFEDFEAAFSAQKRGGGPAFATAQPGQLVPAHDPVLWPWRHCGPLLRQKHIRRGHLCGPEAARCPPGASSTPRIFPTGCASPLPTGCSTCSASTWMPFRCRGRWPHRRACRCSLTPSSSKTTPEPAGTSRPSGCTRPPHEEKDAIRRVNAKAYLKLADPKERPWLHLVDGGVSDNLGLRSIYTTTKLIGNPQDALREYGHPDVRQILIISVNSHAAQTPKWAFERNAPGIAEVIGSMSSDQIDQYTADTLEAVRFTFERWAKQVSTPEHPVRFSFVEVDFEKAADKADRDYLNHIGTSFDLKDEEVDRLISAGREILRESPEFKAFLETNRNRR